MGDKSVSVRAQELKLRCVLVTLVHFGSEMNCCAELHDSKENCLSTFASEKSTLLRLDTVKNGCFVLYIIFSFLHPFSALSLYSTEALTDEKKQAAIEERAPLPNLNPFSL